ncbi:MAG: hypothetical protein NTY13_00545 [Chlamydiae bacterium]|nr:hypothetical protein [Chlamydiota bacterium]
MRDKLLIIEGKRLRGTSIDEHINLIVELFGGSRSASNRTGKSS